MKLWVLLVVINILLCQGIPPNFFSGQTVPPGSQSSQTKGGDSDDGSYYKILGQDINKHSSIDEIKKAYRKRAMQLHPDKGK